MTSESESPALRAELSNDAQARELDEAYAQGDFARLRTRARALRDDAGQAEPLRGRAREWLDRMSVDVVVYGMLAFAFALFCAIVVRYAL